MAKFEMENDGKVSEELQEFFNDHKRPTLYCENSPFFNKLSGLRDKINLFQETFNSKK